MKKYKIFFKNYDENAEEEADEYASSWNIIDAIENFLSYQYDNCDGWEWMPKDCGRTIIVVIDLESGKKEEFNWEIEYQPSFYVYKKEI